MPTGRSLAVSDGAAGDEGLDLSGDSDELTLVVGAYGEVAEHES